MSVEVALDPAYEEPEAELDQLGPDAVAVQYVEPPPPDPSTGDPAGIAL